MKCKRRGMIRGFLGFQDSLTPGIQGNLGVLVSWIPGINAGPETSTRTNAVPPQPLWGRAD